MVSSAMVAEGRLDLRGLIGIPMNINLLSTTTQIKLQTSTPLICRFQLGNKMPSVPLWYIHEF